MSLQVWIPFTGNLDNYGLDSWKPSGTGITYTANGKIGQARSAGTITIPADVCARIFNNGGMSIAFWVYINLDNGATNNRMMFFGNDPTRWFGLFNYPTANDFHWHWANTPKGGSYSNTGVTTVAQGRKNSILPVKKWIHIAVTCDNKFFTMYLNGEQQIHQACLTPMNVSDYSQDTVLISNNSNYYYNDYRIYNHCLSAKEVKELAKGLVLHYRLAGPGQPNLLNGNIHLASAWTPENHTVANYSDSNFTGLKITATQANGRIYNSVSNLWITNNAKYAVSFWAKSDTAGTTIDCSRSIADFSQTFTLDTKWKHYSGIITTTGTSTTGTLSIRINQASRVVYIANIKVENGAIATPFVPPSNSSIYSAMGYNNNIEYDCSGYRQNGTKSGNITWDIDSPRYTTSYKFNGSSYIKNNQFYFNSNIWTVSLWYKRNTAPTDWETIICLSKNDGSDSNKKIGIMLNSNRIWFKAEDNSMSMSSLKIGEWCHLAIVSNGTSATIYENGIQKGTTTMSSSVTGAYDLVIGARASSAGASTTSYYNKGNISDVRIYTTALSAEDIAELYHSAVIVDNTGKTYAYEYFEAQ